MKDLVKLNNQHSAYISDEKEGRAQETTVKFTPLFEKHENTNKKVISISHIS